jgi:uncharacterized membrane protein
MFYLMVSAWIFSDPQPIYPYPLLNDLSWVLHERIIAVAWRKYIRFWGEELKRGEGRR